MCNAYTLKTTWAALEKALRALELETVFPSGMTAETTNTLIPEAIFPRYDGLFLKPTDPAGPLAGLTPAIGHWGLIPFYHKGGPKAWKLSTNNARSETMATSPTFRDAHKNRRCVIPATHITEWSGPKGSKIKHAISRSDGGILFMAGLWDRCKVQDEEWGENYTMVMTDTAEGDDMHRFHSRQPVILDADSARVWLNHKEDASGLYRGPPGGSLVADPPEPLADWKT